MSGVNIHGLEIHTTYRCNIACPNCLCLTHQAPAEMDMDPDWLWQQLEDAVGYDHKWRYLNIHGGEPILHPNYIGIAKAVLWYRDNCGHDCQLAWFSNGLEASKLKEVSDMGVTIVRSQKSSQMPYVPTCHIPAEHGYQAGGCYMSEQCGMALNVNGYWPCSAIAAAERVWGYVSPVRRPEDITEQAMVTLRDQHCHRCGFAVNQPRVTTDLISADWAEKLAEYNKK